jgi:hypothetical protein
MNPNQTLVISEPGASPVRNLLFLAAITTGKGTTSVVPQEGQRFKSAQP